MKPKVLVVDDSLTVRMDVGEALAGAGFDVEFAVDLASARAALEKDGIRLIVLDLLLPDGNGLELLEELKAADATAALPVMLLSTEAEVRSGLSGSNSGADEYLGKPYQRTHLVARARALVHRRATEARGRTGNAMGSGEGQGLLGPKRILAVDDSITYLDLLGSELRREGYDVVLVASGEKALEVLATQSFDCILLDRVMPGLSGEETCSRIKESPELRDLPLIMLTATDEREAMIAGINAGADDYIAKSADFEVLKARLRAQLRRKHFEDENRRIREELVRRETEARFQKLLQSNIIGVVLSDFSGALLDANDAFLALVQHSHDDLVSGRLHWETLAQPATRLTYAVMIERLRHGETCEPLEGEFQRKDGRVVPVLYGLVRQDGTDTTVGFIVDRTAQRNAEEKLKAYAATLEGKNLELELANAQTARQSRFKSQFLAGMSHELRTPLNAIIGFSELLEQELFGALNPRQMEYVRNVLSSGRHLLSLVNDVLDLSKVESGRMELNREWTFLGMVVNVVVEIVAPLAQKRRITLVNEIPENLPKLYFDPVRIKQVLYNLLSNAIKFTPEGGSVRLSAVILDNELEVCCADSGIGIAAEDLPRLFREFEQIGADSTRRAEGTGLGLALTKRFIELHGGTIRVESKVGQGSRFSFALPMLRGDLGPPPADTPVPSPLEPVVLVVEDDAYAIALIAEHLRAAGLAVATASNAADALRLASDLKPAAITLDLMMAGMDGWAILTELRSHPATRTIPIVIISVVDEPNRGLVLGATDYLVKPVSRDALLQSLEMAGVPLHRISGLKVVIAGKQDGDLDNAAGHLKHAGCVVRRLEHFSASALAEHGEIDAFLVELAADAVGELQALLESAEDSPFPIIAIVDAGVTAGKTWRGEVARLARDDVLAVERLVRCIRRSVDKRRERRSSAASIGAPARNGRK